MNAFITCLDNLLSLAKKQEYLTFDDISECAASYGIKTVAVLDDLMDSILVRNIIVLDNHPSAKEEPDEIVLSESDEMVYSILLEKSPLLKPIIEEAKSIPRLKKNEYKQLIPQLKAGNQFALERIVSLNLRVALKIALQTSIKYDVDIEEAVCEACCLLVEVIKKFPGDGFSNIQSYIALGIMNTMLRNVCPQWISFYVPVHYRMKIIKAKQILDYYHYEYSDTRDYPEEIVGEIITKIEDIDTLEEAKRVIFHVQQQELLRIDDEDVTASFSYDGEEEILENISFTLMKEQLQDVLDTVSPREEKILKLRFGLEDGQEKTLEEIGQYYKLTRERIRQIEAKALRKLRHPSRSKKLRNYI